MDGSTPRPASRVRAAHVLEAMGADGFPGDVGDDAVRTLERALAASPGDRSLRERLASLLVRRGEQPRACELLGMRWELESRALRPGRLEWRERELAPSEVDALVQDDLAAFDPLALAAAFPRRSDGAWHGNRTVFLRRYPAHERRAPHRRLLLLAWTPGCANARKDYRGVIVVTVDTRSTFRPSKLLPPGAWRSG